MAYYEVWASDSVHSVQMIEVEADSIAEAYRAGCRFFPKADRILVDTTPTVGVE